MIELGKSLIALVSGAAIWEGFKFIYPEVKQPLMARNEAKETFFKNLDPILKASGELYGKVESLAKEDFATFTNPTNSNSINYVHNRKYVYYLFAQFWAQLEYFRLESQYISLSRLKKGRQLLRFIETIESRNYRILDRSIQRIIGECLISQKEERFRIMTLNQFILKIDDPNSILHKRIKELEKVLDTVINKEKRQIILRFGVIVAALIDNFDPHSRTVRRRAIYLNKLSNKSRRLIKTNLLIHYLPFLNRETNYY